MRKLAQLILYDGDGNTLVDQSDIQVAWFDQDQPQNFASVVYKNGTESTDEDGNLIVDIDSSTSLNENDPGFLLAYKLNATDHHDSLVFAGKLNVSLGILTGADLFLPGDIGFWYWPQDLSLMWQDSAGATAAVLGQPVGKILDKSGNGNHAVQATTSKKPILKRQPTSGIRNLLLASGDLLLTIASGGAWNTSSDWSQISVNPLYPGDKAYQVTNAGVVSSRNISNNIGMSSGERDTLSVITEEALSNKAALTTIGLYDSTTLTFSGRINLKWSTGTIEQLLGNGSQLGYCEKLSDVGPNGGRVFRLVISAITPVGENRMRFLYPTGTNTNTQSVIIHSAQYEVNAVSATPYQQTFGNYDVYEPGSNQVYWLDYDGVDDVLVASNPDLGTNATRIRLAISGAVIEEGLTLDSNLNLSTDNLGLIVINRALSAAEKTAITAYLNKFVGL